MNDIALWIGGGMLTVAALLILFRIERGPSMLDRSIALDMLVAAVVAALAMWSAATGRTDLINVMVVLALVGFVGSVTLARFSAVEPEEERRILSPEEARQQDHRDEEVAPSSLRAGAERASERAETNDRAEQADAEGGSDERA